MNDKSKAVLVAIGIFSICVIVYLLVMNTGIENFQDRETVSEKIKNERDTMEDRLLVNKYRKSYEDTIIELDDLVSVAILSEVLENAKEIAKQPDSSSAGNKIFKINQLKMFKDSLNDAMKTLDKK